MSFKRKLISFSVASVIAVSAGVSAVADTSSTGTADGGDTGICTIEFDDAVMEIDKETLNFSLTKDGRVWYSGKRDSENDGLNNLWAAKLNDAVTVGYRASNGNAVERAISLLNSTVNFTERSDGFDANITCGTLALKFTLQLRYSDGKITVTVPFESIQENSSSYTLEYFLIYPFFDSSYLQTDGQIIIPDGCGASIDLSESTKATQSYSARVYGSDYGISASAVTSTSPLTASVPVLALLYDDGGTTVIAESGDEYCKVNAQVAGITTDYNLAYFTYIYREQYVKYYESAGTSGSSYVAFQEDINEFDIVQTMTLMDGGSSVADVAKVYRDTVELPEYSSDGEGLRLQFLMAENREGMFGTETVAMTTIDYVAEVAGEIADYCGGLNVSLLGYTKGGLTDSYPTHFPVESKTGSKSAYKKNIAALSQKGVSVSFVTDFVRAYEDASVSSYSLSRNLSGQYITIGDSMLGSDANYNLLLPSVVSSNVSKNLKKITDFGGNAEFNSIGNYLYSTHNGSGKSYTRTQTIETFASALEGADMKVSLSKPNAYLYSYCDAAYNMDLSCSGYLIESESVPLVPMILSGSVAMYSSPLNLNYTGRDLILTLIDYNIYPSFILTEEDPVSLSSTNCSGIFTSSYSVWSEDIREVYEEVYGILKNVEGETVVSRESSGKVYVTTYSNGIKIAVNYGDQDAIIDGKTVAGLSAEVL